MTIWYSKRCKGDVFVAAAVAAVLQERARTCVEEAAARAQVKTGPTPLSR